MNQTGLGLETWAVITDDTGIILRSITVICSNCMSVYKMRTHPLPYLTVMQPHGQGRPILIQDTRLQGSRTSLNTRYNFFICNHAHFSWETRHSFQPVLKEFCDLKLRTTAPYEGRGCPSFVSVFCNGAGVNEQAKPIL